MGMPKNLYLVRHGQSEGNLLRRKYEETGDLSLFSENFLNLHESQYLLTEKGEEQAKLAGYWLKENTDLDFYRMLVSNNNRAMQTAALLELEKPAWMIDFNLRERENGIFNVLAPDEIKRDYEKQRIFHDTQPFLFRPPQGENIADVAQRIKIVLDTLARECDGQDVVIVCHGHVIKTFRIILERMSLSESNDYLTTTEDWGRVPNCAIVHYTRQDPKNQNRELSKYLDWMRIIRPAGGGEKEDPFKKINRKKYSNEDLIWEAGKCR
jgi:broad specificity phosphatase PhoE